MNIFQIILIQPLFNLLILLVIWIPGHSLGWAIVALTILIRLVLMPSSAHALRQQHKIQKLQPELQTLRERHKGDQTAQAQAMMALYKKYDIHPLGSCLPMLIQLPILIALYYVFRQGIDLSHLNWLYSFVPRPEAINTHWLGIELAKSYLPLAIAAGVAQFIQSWTLLRAPGQHKAETATQKALNAQLLYFMPVLTVIISLSLPAALPLYWLVTTVFSIGQQWWLFRHLGQSGTIGVSQAGAPPPLAEPVQVVDRPVTPVRGGVSVTVRQRGR